MAPSHSTDWSKVFFFAKDFDTNFGIPGRYTEDYVKLPDLLYVDQVWDQNTRDEWFNLPQLARLDLLSARGNALDLGIPVMPINLVFEKDNYDNIRIVEGLPAGVAMYMNKSGCMYLGSTDDMAQDMTWYRGGQARAIAGTRDAYRGFWQGNKTDIGQYQVNSGPAAAQRLRSTYTGMNPGCSYLYQSIVQKAIEAHDAWVANGGYSIESDVNLGPRVASKVEAAIQRATIPPRSGIRLQELQQTTAAWNGFKRSAVRGWQSAARQGVTALARFMLRDNRWREFSDDEKELVIELWELEEEADEREGQLRNSRPQKAVQ